MCHAAKFLDAILWFLTSTSLKNAPMCVSWKFSIPVITLTSCVYLKVYIGYMGTTMKSLALQHMMRSGCPDIWWNNGETVRRFFHLIVMNFIPNTEQLYTCWPSLPIVAKLEIVLMMEVLFATTSRRQDWPTEGVWFVCICKLYVVAVNVPWPGARRYYVYSKKRLVNHIPAYRHTFRWNWSQNRTFNTYCQLIYQALKCAHCTHCTLCNKLSLFHGSPGA